MASGQSAVSRANAEHYIWGQGCDGWYLVKDDQMTIIEERMPPGTAETLHMHARSRQFFFVLAGTAVMDHGGVITVLEARSGLEIPPGVAHRILNKSHAAVDFLVTSRPPSHADRTEVNPAERKSTKRVARLEVVFHISHGRFRSDARCSMTDNEFIAGFEDCSLAVETFHHGEHVRMAFLHLCRYPPLEALQRFSTSLAKFAAAHDKPRLYHETITWAFMLLIRERMARAGFQQTWEAFSASNQDLLSWKDSVLKKYYREETLSSELARTTFLLPDRALSDAGPRQPVSRPSHATC